MKTLEDEIADLLEDPTELETIYDESTTFEINSKSDLNMISRFLTSNKNSEPEVRRITRPKDSVKLPKLEISKFDGDPVKWQTFSDSFQSAVENTQLGKSKSLITYAHFYKEKR